MKISVIIPTVGRASLQKVVDALLACDDYELLNPEIWVIFNGKDHRKKFHFPPEVSVLYDPQPSVSSARNIGIDRANGDILAFLGDDTLPGKNWLQRMHVFHTENDAVEMALLGHVGWVDTLAEDPFHRWLLNHAQFAYARLKNQKPDWRFFYTSCISVKSALVGEDRFSEQFHGWGFEDIEFGYRLANEGMMLEYDRSWEVFHDHPMNLSEVLSNTKNARNNAFVFEEMHPEVKILPTGDKKILLHFLLWFSWPFQGIPLVYWWREWKKAWLGIDS